MSKEFKRIVCDIDDTISITLNRDFRHAQPVQPVIDKINYLYDLGWEIYLVTARGSLSCKTRKEAREKYETDIKAWLEEHNVKYTALSFEKYLAAYYIDDKGLTPDEFVNLEITNLQDGWSNASVELRDGKVFKHSDDSLRAAEWYKTAISFFNVPRIYSLVGSTLCMEYIDRTSNIQKIDDIVNIIDKFSNIPFVSNYRNDFSTYIDRLKGHIKVNLENDSLSKYHDEIKFFDKYCVKVLEKIYNRKEFDFDSLNSFCHGDLTVENVINRNGDLYLIDPIYENHKDTWSSWILDLTKYMYSLVRHNKIVEYNYLLNKYSKNIYQPLITSLVLAHCIRVFKYCPEDERPHIIEMFHKIYDNKF